jgi:hypothetical protein
MDPRSTSDDAQRDLEQRALRNVRGLVDKMETIDRIDEGAQRRMLLWIVVGGIVAAVGLGALVWFAGSKQKESPIVIESPAPARPALK